MASCISCSWNSGTPRVFSSALRISGCAIGHRLLAVLAPDVRVHRTALDRAGPDQRHLDHQVVELAGLEPGQGGHLGPALHLEHPDRVGPAEHVVDLRVVQRSCQPRSRLVADHVVAVVQRGEHAQPEQVELDQARPPRSRPCPTAARCARASAPTPPGRPRSPAGRRSPCRRSGCPGAAGTSATRWRTPPPARGCPPRRQWRPSPTCRSACSRRPAAPASSRTPWPCRAPPTGAGRR